MSGMDYMRRWGNPDHYSHGFAAVTADRQLRRGLENRSLTLEEIGNAKAVVRRVSDGKWFLTAGGWDSPGRTMMMGAACGDVAGSVYERHNIKYLPDEQTLIRPNARFTDDTVMTIAVAKGIRLALEKLGENWMAKPESGGIIRSEIQRCMQEFGRKYPYAGYGGSFSRWITAAHPQPYNSWGNGSAMRASYAGWAARTLEEAETLGRLSAEVTHNHPEGIRGAQVVAGIIHQLRTGADKAQIRRYAQRHYPMEFTLDSIRGNYRFDVSCQGSVPQAIEAFLEGTSFANVIALAISIGGDSDTIAAIAGSMAEVLYPIPQGIRGRVIDRMDPFLLAELEQAVDFDCARIRSQQGYY